MPFFRVKTFDENGLREAAGQLMGVVEQAFSPNLLIGVRTGGFFVAEHMANLSGIVLLPLTCKRSSTQKKESSTTLKRLLKAMPYCITNPLRIAEHIALTQLRPPKPQTKFTPDAKEVAVLQRRCDTLGSDANILIVDDAVDSGATLKAVRELMSTIAPRAQIRTAAVTLTTSNALIQPDFKLYHHVLCRFPWAFDFKQ